MTTLSMDADLAACLKKFAQLDANTPAPHLNYAQRRRLLSELQARALRQHSLPGIAVHNHFIAAPGREIPVRTYTPTQHHTGQTLVWLHGGGWMVGSLDTHDDLCEHLAHYSGHTVLSIHYRRTPENSFADALDDVQAVLQWLQDMQGIWSFATANIFLGGDSAGGHLALATATHAVLRPEAVALPIQGLLLLYPCLIPQQVNASMQAYAQGFGLTPDAMEYYWQALGADEHPLRCPSLCESALPFLPPMAIMTASHDILRDEAEAFVAQLHNLPCTAPVLLHRAQGMVHGFARMLMASPAARQQVQKACGMLKQLYTK